MPRLLDLFCGAGGAAMGYHRAGFDVVGVDIRPQPNYPFEFIEYDALEFVGMYNLDADVDGLRFSAVHASPPCQAYSDLRTMRGVAGAYPDLVDAVRELLVATHLPYVIENVPGSPVAAQNTLDGRYGIRLDGAMFGLEEGEYGLERERWFECSFPIVQPNGRRRAPLRVGVHGGGQPGRHGGRDKRVMGIDWMTRDELNEAIPPAYTELIGHQLMAHVKARAA
jgi:DNA (cytosine-5)-methyltransferase 1